MSLQTPDAIRTLQRKLYGKAKAEPSYRFYLLYDKVWRADILRHAYDRARANDGAPGVDGATFDRIEAAGLEDWLARLGEELRTKTYQCQAVRRVMIPKPDGGERPLGIPTIRDRVVQTAAKLVLEPILEADLDPAAFGYRPERSAGQAIQLVLTLLRQGYTDVVDADLSKYFDTIPHQDLMRSLARRVVDADMLWLVKQWLKAPVETTGGDGRKRLGGGKANRQGVPQGGVISPLIANLYMNRFLKHWRQTGKGDAWKAQVINYADDFVILSRGHAAEALAWTDATMARLGLTLNRTTSAMIVAPRRNSRSVARSASWRSKPRQVVVTAIPRELAGFVWAIACITSDPPAKTSAVTPASEEVGLTGCGTATVSSRNASERHAKLARPGMRQTHARRGRHEPPEEMTAEHHSTG
jgi:RNA-directed DNA polymerase